MRKIDAKHIYRYVSCGGVRDRNRQKASASAKIYMFLLVLMYVRDRNKQKVSAFYSLQKETPLLPLFRKNARTVPHTGISVPIRFVFLKGLCYMWLMTSTAQDEPFGETIHPQLNSITLLRFFQGKISSTENAYRPKGLSLREK